MGLLLSLVILYVLFVFLLWIGWRKALRRNPGQTENASFITVLLPVRNEAENLPNILQDLKQQLHRPFEVLVIDDHSTDSSGEVVLRNTFSQIRLVTNSGIGKKSALTTGVREARGDIILTTDADCRIPPSWISSFNACFRREDVKFVFGGVALADRSDFFSALQRIEFSSLVVTAAASSEFSRPVLCNGASLGFRKSVFNEVDGFSGNERIPSGDDEFLMRKVVRHYPDGVVFNPLPIGIVKTAGPSTLRSFFQQRIRWASKWRFNSSWLAVTTALLLLLWQGVFLYCWYDLVANGDLRCAILLVFKSMLDAMLLKPVCRFLNMRWSWVAFFCLQIIYPVYVLTVGILSNFLPYTWKERTYAVKTGA